MFKSLKGTENEHETPKITYIEFLEDLKTACATIGLNPSLFPTPYGGVVFQINSRMEYRIK
jgi:hypothetical protein